MIPLRRYPALKSRDPTEVYSSIQQRQPGVHHFEPVMRSTRRWGIEVNFIALKQIGITSTRSSAYSMNAAPDGFARVFVPFGSPFRVDYRSGSREFKTGLPGLMAQEDGRAHFQPHFATLLATIPLKPLDEAMIGLGSSLGVECLLHRQCPDPAVLGVFATHLAFVVRSIDEYGMMLYEDRFKALHQELLILHLADALVRYETLETKPLASPVVRRALDLIGDRLREDLRISEIAAYAGCSIRSLQKAFQSTFQTTITGYIRSERLKGARHMLETPRETTNVTGVALENGFSHLSDFACRYREAYGESPSSTLENARRSRLSIVRPLPLRRMVGKSKRR